jgi:hypothetical protein
VDGESERCVCESLETATKPRSTMIRHNDSFALVLIGRAGFVLIRGKEARKTLGRYPKEDEALVAMFVLIGPEWNSFVGSVFFLSDARKRKTLGRRKGPRNDKAPKRGRQRYKKRERSFGPRYFSVTCQE